MRKTIILLTCIFCYKIVLAQLPVTNIYVFDMKQESDSSFIFTNPKFLTGFNSDGYNNQPAFFSNDEIYFTSGEASGATPTNIYALDLKNRTKTQVTRSEDKEYSPTSLIAPFYFSCIRQEADGKNTQRLWVFPKDRSSKGEPIFPDATGIGYHCWLNEEEVALFVVGEPHKLAIGNTSDKSLEVLTSNIGRSMNLLSNGNLAYVHKATETNWTIKELDLESRRSTTIVSTVTESEDFVVLPNNTFLMAQGSKLYKYRSGYDTKWFMVADFSKQGIKHITRIAVSEGRIALVDIK